MRALAIALLGLGPLLGACKSAPVADVAPESPAERFDRIERRWAAIWKLQFPDLGQRGSRPPPDPKARDAELESLFREMAALAPNVPGAIEFCVDAGRLSPHSDFFAFRTRSMEALQALVR